MNKIPLKFLAKAKYIETLNSDLYFESDPNLS